MYALEELGPTYVKFGQAIASRPDIIPKRLAASLSNLQDGMKAFDTTIAKGIIRDELQLQLQSNNISISTIDSLLDSLSEEPVAAASVGQVYKGYLPNVGYVAVKVQRPGLKPMVEKDAALLRKLASFLESLPNPTNNGNERLINTELVAAVDEFMSRVFEELDYRNEAANAKLFAQLYSNRYGTAKLPNGGVIVPEIMTEFCTEHVLVMEWIDGSKLTSFSVSGDKLDGEEKKENLELIEQALYVTLSQLLEFGVMHAGKCFASVLQMFDLRI